MQFYKQTLLASTFLITSTTFSYADIKVVASIKPIHSLVSAITEGIGEPILLVKGAGSPHTYSLKPSQAKELQEADVIFWMGHDLEAFLENSIDNIAANAMTISLMESDKLTKFNFREGGTFDDHGHDDHGDDKHDDHDDHGHDKHDDHDDHGHDKHDDHDDHGADPHVWLDPVNAIVLVQEIKNALIAADPKNEPAFEENARVTIEKLNELISEIDAELEPVKGRGYVVFHDAYQYFENRFGVTAVGSITVSPEVLPGAERIREIQNKVRELDATCVFSEPQFEPKLVATVTENTNAGTGVLDPLGASISSGPQLYFTLIRNMANSLKKCLLQAK